MKRLVVLLFLFSALCAAAQVDQYVPKRPSLGKLVNDFTNTLTPEQVSILEKKLVEYENKTTNQLAVVIIPTTGPSTIEEVGLQILRSWGVGLKDKNNGVVILVARNDRKVRIELGYGMEKVIADSVAATIIDTEIVPRFKEGNFYNGLCDGAAAIMEAAAGKYKRAKTGMHFLEENAFMTGGTAKNMYR